MMVLLLFISTASREGFPCFVDGPSQKHIPQAEYSCWWAVLFLFVHCINKNYCNLHIKSGWSSRL